MPRRVAAHLAERLDALREQVRTRAHARGGQCGLRPGVTAADDDDVEALRMLHVPYSMPAKTRPGAHLPPAKGAG